MPIRSPGGIAELNYLARKLGDFSSAHKTVLGDAEAIGNRVTNRILGRIAGRATSFGYGACGVFGVVLVGQFFASLRHWIEYKASSPVWVGTMASYAKAHDTEGWVFNGTVYPPHYFFQKAIEQTMTARSDQNNPLTSFFRPPRFFDTRGKLDIRGGIYGGQRFISDLGSFVNGNMLHRLGRRMGGQDIHAFFWGTLRHPKRNPMEVIAASIARNARRNLRDGDWIDTRMLHNSIIYAPDQVAFHQGSIAAALEALRRAGRESEAERRLSATKSKRSGYFWTNYTGAIDPSTGGFIA